MTDPIKLDAPTLLTALSDIIAQINTLLATNTTGDISATDLRTVLIDSFTSAFNSMIPASGVTSPTQAANLARTVKSNGLMLPDVRMGQVKPGFGVPFTVGGDSRWVYNMAALGGLTSGTGLNFDGTTSAVEGMAVSDFFVVPPSGKITAFKLNSVGICFYDTNKTFISQVSGDGLTTPQVVTVPANAVYGRVGVEWYGDANNTIDKFQLLAGDWSATGLPYHPWQTLIARASMFRPWIGRCWSNHGDAWWDPTVGNDWFTKAGQYHGVVKIKCEAHGGGTVATLLNSANPANPLPLSFWDEVDACFVFCGLKDAIVGTTIGSITDSTSTTTFYGYYKKFIETVLTQNPWMRMILAVPHDLADLTTSEATIENYRVAVRALANRYSLKLLDIKGEGQWSPATWGAYCKTGTPNNPGWHQGGITPANPAVKRDWGSNVVYGGPLKGLMHTVLPVDHQGDPLLIDGTNPIIVS
jgi:hypothetical protein